MIPARHRILCLLLPLLICLWTARFAIAQTNSAAPATVSNTNINSNTKPEKSIEDEPLQAADAETKPAGLRGSDSPVWTTGTTGSTGSSDLTRIVFALAIVIGLILLLRGLVRKLSSPGIGSASRLVTVLSRSMISPKQQILVLQVGNRLLVVGDSGGAMSQLCEVTDPDEIAQLIGQSRAKPSVTDRKFGSFASLFGKATMPFNETETTDEQMVEQTENQPASTDPAPAPVTVEDVGGLLDKIRLLQQQFKLKA